MSADYRPRSGGQGRNRGRRQGGRGGSGGQGSERRHSSSTSHEKPAAKKNLLEKILGWFVKPKAKSSHTARSHSNGDARPARAERPERPERPRNAAPAADEKPQEITNPKLYVGNLSYEAAESDLFDLFSKIGAVKTVEVVKDRQSERSKGFGFVEMEALESAVSAAQALNRTDFMGRQIVVSGAKTDRR